MTLENRTPSYTNHRGSRTWQTICRARAIVGLLKTSAGVSEASFVINRSDTIICLAESSRILRMQHADSQLAVGLYHVSGNKQGIAIWGVR